MDFTPRSRTELYIGGEWVAPIGNGNSEVENPATEQVIATVPSGGVDDVDRAVAAARAAFGPWSALAPAERAAHLQRLHDALTKRADARLQTNTGRAAADRPRKRGTTRGALARRRDGR